MSACILVNNEKELLYHLKHNAEELEGAFVIFTDDVRKSIRVRSDRVLYYTEGINLKETVARHISFLGQPIPLPYPTIYTI